LLLLIGAYFCFNLAVRAETSDSQTGDDNKSGTRQGNKNRTTEVSVFRHDIEGKLLEVSRTVTKESESTSGEKRKIVETYSVDMPGWTRDGSLHLIERATTVQRTSPTGQQTTEQTIEQPDFGDPSSSLKLVTVITDVVRPDPSGAQTTRTI